MQTVHFLRRESVAHCARIARMPRVVAKELHGAAAMHDEVGGCEFWTEDDVAFGNKAEKRS